MFERRCAEWCAEFDTRRLFTLPSAEGVACLGCHLTYEFNTSTYDITASLETSHHPVRSLHRFDVDTWILQREKNTESGLLWTLVSSSNTFKMNQICIFIDSVKNWKNDLLLFIAQCVCVS